MVAGCAGHGAAPPDAPASEDFIEIDSDGDGVGDSEDNCIASPNPDQRDLDHDGHGDPCDACPLWIGGFDDRDGDGIGDVCDPNPDRPGDRISIVDDLRALDFERWEPESWLVRPTGLLAVAGANARLRSREAFEQPSLELLVQVVDATELPRALEVRVDDVRCRFFHDPAFWGIELAHASTSTRVSGIGLQEGLHRMQVVTGAGHSRCLATNFERLLELTTPTGLPRGHVEISTEQLGVGLLGVVVYDRPTSR